MTPTELPGADTRVKLDAITFFDDRYQMLLREAARVGWPIAFCGDLYVRDREKLAIAPVREMVWILRESGTHLYPCRCTTSAEASFYRRVIEYWSGDDRPNTVPSGESRARFYLLTPWQLRHVGWQAARARIHVQSGGETSGP